MVEPDEFTSGRHGYTAGTDRAPHRHISHGSGPAFHGFVYQAADGSYVIEHCQAGTWGTCPLGPAGATDQDLMLAAIRHGNRRPHQAAGARLAGVAHAPWPWKRP